MLRKKTLKGQQRWTDKKLTSWALASLFLMVLQDIFSLELIGDRSKYHLLIDYIPLVIGLISLAYFRRHFLAAMSGAIKALFWKTAFWGFMLLQGLLFSYCSFGLVARTIADQLNRMEVRKGPPEIEQNSIREAFMVTGRRLHSSIRFYRNDRLETISTSYIKELNGQRWDPPYNIVLHTRPGILGTTIVLDYKLVHR